MKVLITGGNGYIARNIKPLFEAAGYEVVAPSHRELDLLNYDMTFDYLMRHRPDIIIHAATKGGRRLVADTWEEVLVPNLKMFQVLSLANAHPGFPRKRSAKIITFGSGAEFDRSHSICCETEKHISIRCPLDPYGLSKNMISRLAAEWPNTTVVRLFGCFNHDEDSSRFIKRNILLLKAGLPMEIHQNKNMDFFYLDDVFTVIDWIINEHPKARDFNLVYGETHTLNDIAHMIKHYANKPDAEIKILQDGFGNDYTGNYFGALTDCNFPRYKFVGLKEGIRRTVAKLL